MSKVIQFHHIQYAHPTYKSMKDIVVPLWKGEHNVLVKLAWCTSRDVSQGFIQALEIFIAQRKYDAIDLKEKK